MADGHSSLGGEYTTNIIWRGPHSDQHSDAEMEKIFFALQIPTIANALDASTYHLSLLSIFSFYRLTMCRASLGGYLQIHD